MPVTAVEHPNASNSPVPQSRTRRGRLADAGLAGRGSGTATVLFLTAGTWDFPEAWAWLLGVFVPLAAVTTLFLRRDPGVVEYRLEGDRRLLAPRQLARRFAPLFVLAFLVPGLDTRYGWSDVDVETVPHWLALLADSLIVMSILFGAHVARVTAGVRRSKPGDSAHAILSTGPYHLIRHPLFAASLLAWLATPVALGSWIALPVFLLVTPYYVLHLRAEERQLMKRLPGYAAYCKRTPFRLVPFIW